MTLVGPTIIFNRPRNLSRERVCLVSGWLKIRSWPRLVVSFPVFVTGKRDFSKQEISICTLAGVHTRMYARPLFHGIMMISKLLVVDDCLVNNNVKRKTYF